MSTSFSPYLQLPFASVCPPATFSVGPPAPLAVYRICLVAWLYEGDARLGPVLLESAEPVALLPAATLPPCLPPPTGLMLWIQILACPRPLSIDALPDSYNRSSILLLAPLFSPALHLPLASVCPPEMFSVGPPFPLAVPRSCLMAWLSGGGA